MKRPPDTGSNDFYTLIPWITPLGDDEAEAAGEHINDDLVQAETLMNPMILIDGSVAYRWSGQIPDGDSDVFKAAVGPAVTKIGAVCWAQYWGSGARGLTLDLLGPDGTSLVGGPVVDGEQDDPSLEVSVDIQPNTIGTMFVSLSTAAPSVAATPWYFCSVVLE